MRRPRADLLRQHADEASVLYARLRRSALLLDGNARQTRSLVARLAAHCDALALFAADAAGLVDAPVEARGTGDRFVAAFVAAASGAPLDGLAAMTFDREAHVAIRDAMVRCPNDHARAALEAWLASGSDSARAVAVEVLAYTHDPRAAKVASRAVRRGEGALRAAGVCALARSGEPVPVELALDAMGGCGGDRGWREAVLDAVGRVSDALALDVARRWEGARCDLAWVTLALSGEGDDRERLCDAWATEGAVGALAAALAMTGDHRALLDAWEGAAALPVSNALREAACVVLGGEAPPVVVRDDFPEEPEDVAQRTREDAAWRERMAAAEGAPWRWGRRAEGEWQEAVEALGPRHGRWARAALGAAWQGRWATGLADAEG